MSLKPKFSHRFLLVPALLTATLLSACSPQSNPDVTARQDMMKNWGDAMGVMGDMMKAPDTFDAAVFKEQANFLAEDAKNPWKHFEDKDAVGNTTDAVWSNTEGFRAEAEKFQKATADLKAAADNATSIEQVQAPFKEVGGSCKSCHTDYKVKED